MQCSQSLRCIRASYSSYWPKDSVMRIISFRLIFLLAIACAIAAGEDSSTTPKPPVTSTLPAPAKVEKSTTGNDDKQGQNNLAVAKPARRKSAVSHRGYDDGSLASPPSPSAVQMLLSNLPALITLGKTLMQLAPAALPLLSPSSAPASARKPKYGGGSAFDGNSAPAPAGPNLGGLFGALSGFMGGGGGGAASPPSAFGSFLGGLRPKKSKPKPRPPTDDEEGEDADASVPSWGAAPSPRPKPFANIRPSPSNDKDDDDASAGPPPRPKPFGNFRPSPPNGNADDDAPKPLFSAHFGSSPPKRPGKDRDNERDAPKPWWDKHSTKPRQTDDNIKDEDQPASPPSPTPDALSRPSGKDDNDDDAGAKKVLPGGAPLEVGTITKSPSPINGKGDSAPPPSPSGDLPQPKTKDVVDDDDDDDDNAKSKKPSSLWGFGDGDSKKPSSSWDFGGPRPQSRPSNDDNTDDDDY